MSINNSSFSYLFVPPFKDNSKGAMANQVFGRIFIFADALHRINSNDFDLETVDSELIYDFFLTLNERCYGAVAQWQNRIFRRVEYTLNTHE